MALADILAEHKRIEDKGLSQTAVKSLNIRLSNKKIGISEERLEAIKPYLR